jgi:hypothetical protein
MTYLRAVGSSTVRLKAAAERKLISQLQAYGIDPPDEWTEDTVAAALARVKFAQILEDADALESSAEENITPRARRWV